MKKRVLITGSGSYVGSWVRRRLESEPDKFEVEELSVRGGAWRGFDFSRFDSVFHVAGIAHVSAEPRMEPEYMRVNRDLAVEVGMRAKAAGVGQLIFMSSAIVYGDAAPAGRGVGITPETPPAPSNFYGRSKLEAEEGLRALEGGGFGVAVLRCPMVYGPGCKGNFPLLASLARKAPVFPKVGNRRSAIYVGNLAELVALLVSDGGEGLFWPQDGEYLETGGIVRALGEAQSCAVRLNGTLAPLARLASRYISVGRKAFGDLWYDLGACASPLDALYRRWSRREALDAYFSEKGVKPVDLR